MTRFANPRTLLRVLIALIIIVLLGIAPWSYRVSKLLWAAQLSLKAGSQANAAQAIAEAAELIPWRTRLWEQAGHYAMQGGDAQAAINYFSQADSRSFLSPSGYLALGDAYQHNGDIASAAHWWEAALRLGIPSGEVYSRLLPVHRNLGDYTAMIADLQALLDVKPDDIELHYRLGLLLAASRPEEALAHLNQVTELDPTRAEETGKLAQNIRIARLKDDPAFTLLEAGRALGSLNEWELAAEAFRQAAQVRPEYAEAWAYLGEARQHLPDTQVAEDGLTELDRALQIDPGSLSALLFLGLYWQRQGQLDRSLEYLNEAADLYPNNPTLQTEIGHTLALQGDLNAAQQAYRRAIELAPLDSTYYRLLAEFSLEHEYQLNQVGMPAARRALLLAPNDPASLDTLGQVLFGLGDSASAKRFFERAVLLEPQYAPAHLHLGLVYILEEDRTAAYEKFNQVLSLAPGTPTAEQALRLLQNYFP